MFVDDILMSDIKQAFLNVVIWDDDRDFLRFLCYDDPFSTGPNIITLRFLCVVSRINSSPFFLKATIKYHLERYLNDAKDFVDNFLNDLHVDDSTSWFFNVKEAHHFYLNIKWIMKEGGFELRKLTSNSVELINKINRKGNISCSDSSNESNHTRKVLGITWDLAADAFIFYFDELVNEAYSLRKKIYFKDKWEDIWPYRTYITNYSYNSKCYFKQYVQTNLIGTIL